MMWRWLKLPFLILAVVLIAVGVSIAMNPQWIRLESVQVDMQSESGETLIFQRISSAIGPQYQKLAGKFFWQVPLSMIYDIAAHDKRVRKVSVYREFPNRVRVEILPHTPVMAYLSSDHRFYPIAKDATLLPALPAGEFPDLPIIRGEELKDEQTLREAALDLYDKIPSEGTLRKGAVSEIVFNKKEGFKVFLSSVGGEVKLGDSDFGPKISRVEKVLSYLESQNVKGRVIDARFSKKVVVRVRNTP